MESDIELSGVGYPSSLRCWHYLINQSRHLKLYFLQLNTMMTFKIVTIYKPKWVGINCTDGWIFRSYTGVDLHKLLAYTLLILAI